MSHEARINDALMRLGEEFRLGMIQADEYRSRRRGLLESWYEKEVTTSPGTLRSAGYSTIPPGEKKAIAPAGIPKGALIGAVVVVGIVASGWLMFAQKKAPEGAAEAMPAPVQAPASPQVLAARKAAEDFLAANAWDPAQIEAVLVSWRLLSPEDRVRAREEPAIRTLRFKLDQNLQAESQLVAPDAPPEDRQRLDLLTRFAQELDV